MVARAIELLVSIIPLAVILPLLTGLFGGGAETRSVSKSATNVSRIEIQKTFVSTRRSYAHVFLRIKNNTGAVQNYYIRVGAYFDNQTDTLTDDKIIYADKVSLNAGEVKAFTVVAPIVNPSDSQRFLNKWIITELGAPADVLLYSYSESEV